MATVPAKPTMDSVKSSDVLSQTEKPATAFRIMGESIFVQSDDNRAPGDEFRSLN